MSQTAARTLIHNATLFDSQTLALRPHSTVLVEGDRIAAVSQQALQVDDVQRRIDAGGRVLLPGLIDAHVHVMAVTHDVLKLSSMPPSPDHGCQ